MAAAEAAAAVPASSPPALALADHSPSNISSPLTEVEDKDGDPDDMDLDGPLHNSSSLSNANLDEDDDDARSHSASDNEEESALSEVEPDVNDSEAETERLYNTPTKAKNIKDGAVDADSSPEMTSSPTKRLAAQTRDRTFQASPSKLKQQLHADSDADDDNDDENDDDEEEEEEALSGAEDEEKNNEADGEEEAAVDDSEAPGGRSNGTSRRRRSIAAREQAAMKAALRSQSPNGAAANKATKEEAVATDKDETPAPPTLALLRSQRSNSDTRKRKRSPATDPSESDQPLRKRLGSNGAGALRDGAVAATTEGDDGTPKAASKRPNGTTGSRDEPNDAETAIDEKPDQTAENSAEGTNSDMFRTRRSRRGASAKKRSSSEEGNVADEDVPDEQNKEDATEDAEAATAEEDATAQGEDEPLDGDIDEEAEAAHRNEEEMERKKAALDNLHSIEKQFASFRDKLYQERLDQLNQEEAMLAGDNPTHPEYLAMMQCVDERRDEKLRVIDLEHHYNMQTLKRWAVARRSQIHAQYFQSVRESRELVLEELGRQWYQIQQQRRRHANTIPDYGLRFPASKIQRTKDAITYNKEVSILAGIAKYEGFPAAPQIKGASTVQVDDDLEAIARGRQAMPQAQLPAPQGGPVLDGLGATPYPELAGAVGGGGAAASGGGTTNGGAAVSFNSLGAAGQQFLADTPWANPHHPSHHLSQHAPPHSFSYSHSHPSPPPRHPFPHPHIQRQQQESQHKQTGGSHYPGVAGPPPEQPQPLPTTNSRNTARKPLPQQPAGSSGSNGGPAPRHHHHHHHSATHHHHHHSNPLHRHNHRPLNGSANGDTATGTTSATGTMPSQREATAVTF